MKQAQSRSHVVRKRSMLVTQVWYGGQTNAEVEAMMGGAGGDDQLIQSLSNNPL